jgi:hypothetical protein
MGVSPMVQVLLHIGSTLPIKNERSDLLIPGEEDRSVGSMPTEYRWLA